MEEVASVRVAQGLAVLAPLCWWLAVLAAAHTPAFEARKAEADRFDLATPV